MNDLASQLRRALDQVQPIGVSDIHNAARKRRARRRRAGLSAAAVTGVAVIVLGVFGLPVSRSTKVRTTSPGGNPAASTPSPRLNPAEITAGLPPGAQVTSVIRYRNEDVAAGDDFPAGSTPVLPVCARQGCNPVVWTSTDGAHWSATWGAKAGGSIAGETLVASPDTLLLFNADESTNLWESTDAVTWRHFALPPAFAALVVRDVVYGHGRFVAILNNKYAGGPVTAYGESDTVWTSTNGATWTQDPVPGAAAIFQSVSVEPTGFQISGVFRQGEGRATWTSTDGISWSVGAIPSTTTPPASAGQPATTAKPCQAPGLTLRGGRQGENQGAHGDIIITNTGRRACTLEGPPTVEILKANAGPLAIRPLTSTLPTGTVVLGPGQSASAAVYWSNWCHANPGPLDIAIRLASGTVTGPFNGPPDYNQVPGCTSPTGPSTLQVIESYLLGTP